MGLRAQGWFTISSSSVSQCSPGKRQEAGGGVWVLCLEGLRGVDDHAVPLALDVFIRRLLGDVEPIKLQLPGDLLLSFKHHQGHLGLREGWIDGWWVDTLKCERNREKV